MGKLINCGRHCYHPNPIAVEKIAQNIGRKEIYKAMLVALGLAIAVAGYFYGFKFDGQITGFFRIGSVLPLSPLLNPAETLIYQGELGYDGQQFLTIALDPGLQNDGSIAALDHPSYRYRRILYPLLGYVLGLGNPVLIPWALVLINIVAIAICTGLTALYFQYQKQKAIGALAMLAIPGVWMVLFLSTADLLASAFSLGAVVCQQIFPPNRSKKWWLVPILLALGLLTRETSLIIWLAIALTLAQNRQWRSMAVLLTSLIPITVWLGYIRWRQLPGGSGSGNFGWPFVGIGEKFQSLIQGGLNGNNVYEGYLWFLLWLTFALLIWFTRPPTPKTLTYASGLYGGLLLVASFYILNYYLNYSRVFLDVFLLTILAMASGPRWTSGLYLAIAGLGSITFLLLKS
ncbi:MULTISPECIES: AZOBR_p60025 family cell surface glycopolymer formation protein [unclassified Synechocystis]|uniref:AZOBR_p60025 family cell surface glycopolymer formation protein n=1 Tax=unclassified Synechocystis TaxID=2640012 RepID=UPI0003FBE04D|nr:MULTISPECIES: hypothetical protein [unclassified Synechocystis]AIE73806.1 hypothetical protein D082_12780 [Synechocystis sp. PCC 6714]MCT0252372.1 hypothetical protein [Synechocystis sp. CS-94]